MSEKLLNDFIKIIPDIYVFDNMNKKKNYYKTILDSIISITNETNQSTNNSTNNSKNNKNLKEDKNKNNLKNKIINYFSDSEGVYKGGYTLESLKQRFNQ